MWEKGSNYRTIPHVYRSSAPQSCNESRVDLKQPMIDSAQAKTTWIGQQTMASAWYLPETSSTLRMSTFSWHQFGHLMMRPCLKSSFHPPRQAVDRPRLCRRIFHPCTCPCRRNVTCIIRVLSCWNTSKFEPGRIADSCRCPCFLWGRRLDSLGPGQIADSLSTSRVLLLFLLYARE